MAIMLRVITTNMRTGETEMDRTIDHLEKPMRMWLGNHTFWAVRNERAVEVIPMLDEGDNKDG